MGADESLRTQIDDLLASLKSSAGTPLSVTELSSASGLSAPEVQKWLSILEKNGQIRIENRLSGIYASWAGEPEKIKLAAPDAVDVGERTTVSSSSFESEFDIARQRERAALGRLAPTEITVQHKDKLRHKVILEAADADLAEVGEKILKINTLISKLKEKRRAAKDEASGEKQPAEQENAKSAKQPGQTNKAPEKSGPSSEQKQPLGELLPANDYGLQQAVEAETGLQTETQQPIEETPAIMAELPSVAVPKKLKYKKERQAAKEKELGQPRLADPEESSLIQEPSPSVTIKPLEYAQKKMAAISKIKKPEPLQPTAVSLQFSEKLARHVKKIVNQTQEIEKLKMEKEKLLSEHYLPMQRKLEVEIETISDRVLRMEKNILNMQQRASELPSKVTNVEKLQISTIKAHSEMRRAYDEAVALVEESSNLLSEERERMEVMVDQSRQEISAHRSKTEELEGTLRRISEMENQAEDMVISARAALAEQAERLASAEKNAQELSQLKGEITESVSGIKREISTAKGALTSIEKQMQQMRQIELWADSIRQEYDKKMLEVDDYIRNGNQEYDTLRESVEANFVRRYLRELRALTDSYAFEFNQAKNVEGNLDQRISEEKKKLDDLLEEGRKISYLYEMQAREIPGSDKFESRADEFRSLSGIAAQRTQLEQMIAQVVGKQSEYQPKEAPLWPKEARKVASAKPAVQKKAKLVSTGKTAHTIMASKAQKAKGARRATSRKSAKK